LQTKLGEVALCGPPHFEGHLNQAVLSVLCARRSSGAGVGIRAACADF
jgi:hypothetical protein